MTSLVESNKQQKDEKPNSEETNKNEVVCITLFRDSDFLLSMHIPEQRSDCGEHRKPLFLAE
jgi:hypothetical protein